MLGERAGAGPLCTAQRYAALSGVASPARLKREMQFDWTEILKDVDAQLDGVGLVAHEDVALDPELIESHARAIAAGRLSNTSSTIPKAFASSASRKVSRSIAFSMSFNGLPVYLA